MVDLRSTLNVHGSNLLVQPAHGLQRGVVVRQLKLAAHHVFQLVDGHAGLLVVLREGGKKT